MAKELFDYQNKISKSLKKYYSKGGGVGHVQKII